MLPSITKILYATDLSFNARHALGYAAALADQKNATLTVLHILPDELEQLSEGAGMDLSKTFGEEAAHWINQGDSARAAQAIHERLTNLSGEDFSSAQTADHIAHAQVKVVCGDAGTRIRQEAEEGKYDLIVMGTHGHGGLLGLLMGSVATETIRRSKIPVLVVPLPDET